MHGDDYFDRWGKSADRDLVRRTKESNYRRFLRTLGEPRPGCRLLDVGCAFGFLLGVALELGFDAYGVEPNPQAADLARGQFGDRVQVGPLGPQLFPGEHFDVVTLIDVFEHVPDPIWFLDAVRERLPPGGRCLAVLPNAASWTRRLMRRHWPLYAGEHLFHWSPANLARFMTGRGWNVSRIETGLRKTFTAAYLRSYAKHAESWVPPGLGWLGNVALRIPTGEMLVLAERIG